MYWHIQTNFYLCIVIYNNIHIYSFKLNLDNSHVTWNMSYTLALVIRWVLTLTIACVSCIILIRYTGKSRAQFESKN